MKHPLLLTLLCTVAGATQAQYTEQEIGQIAAEYLVENPQFLLEASKNLQEIAQNKAMAEQIDQVLVQKEALINNDTPFIGNAKGNIAIIKFFDYQCGYCGVMAEHMKSLVKENNDVKVYLKETPIFGARSEPSLLAAEWAMEIFTKKGNQAYENFHNALWHAAKNNGNQLSNDLIKDQVEKAGLAFEDDTKFMTQTPQENVRLFSQLGFRGTPALIVMPTEGANKDNVSVIAGADIDEVRKAIEKAQS
ncbi:DsbA family protein [Vibrio paucivorans]|uniref:Thioredoxin domain-containing protein n=1 Tax=Vibrio paucivorans TaxID=2829489 RepID=A0A9X3CFD1_9VIBR|nr:DsbA family protein [Vibrio paucivorans]MCW8334439.1 thioredoxin domain-containing protein [Vibrio paucivorans]